MNIRIFIALLIVTCNNLKGQNLVLEENNDIIYFNDYSTEDSGDTTNNEETPPFPVDDTPINDYLPLLAVAAVGLGFYYRKDLIKSVK